MIALAAAFAVAKLTVTEPSKAFPYKAPLIREATFVFGPSAPVPLFAGQIQQESGWDCKVTAWDGGQGCAQFMEGTAGWLAKRYPELAGGTPYDPIWAFRAQARLNQFNFARVKGEDECNKWAATLLAYNAGLGTVQAMQRESPSPARYWDVTEQVIYHQTQQNVASSRAYPRRIVFKHQPLYQSWGRTVCLEK